MGNTADLLFGTLIIVLQYISVRTVTLFFHHFLVLQEESTKNIISNTTCFSGALIHRKVDFMVCISPICSVVAIFFTIQSIYRPKGNSDKVVASWIGISTSLAASSCCLTYIRVRSISRQKLYDNICVDPNDIVEQIFRIVAVGTRLLFDNMTEKGDMLFGVLIIILQCISFGMVGLCFLLPSDLPESTKSFLPDTVCTTDSSIDRQMFWMICISPLCSVVAIVLTIQTIYRREGYSNIVATSRIGICTISAGLSCFMYIVLRALIRSKLYKNGCECPNDNFLEALIIVGVGAVCHIVSTLLFGIWRIKNRKNSSFLHDNIRGKNNGKSRFISIWTVSNQVPVVNTLSYSHNLKATAAQKSAVY